MSRELSIGSELCIALP